MPDIGTLGLTGGLAIIGIIAIVMGLKILKPTWKLEKLSYLIPVPSLIWFLYWILYDLTYWNKSPLLVSPTNYAGLAVSCVLFLPIHKVLVRFPKVPKPPEPRKVKPLPVPPPPPKEEVKPLTILEIAEKLEQKHEDNTDISSASLTAPCPMLPMSKVAIPVFPMLTEEKKTHEKYIA